MQPKRYETSVHLVTYNGLRWLPFCLSALEQQTYKDFFLLVVDNGSLDGSAEFAEKFLKMHPELERRARVVRNKQNVGFSRAHNQAILWTDSIYVVMMNQDLWLEPTHLENLVAALSSDPRAAAVSGKLLRWDFDDNTFNPEQLRSAKRIIDSIGLGVRRTRNVFNLSAGQPDDDKTAKPREVFGVAGTVPLYRREALQDVSPTGEVMDEDFVSFKEDVDLAWRLRQAGYTAWYAPQAVAWHTRTLKGNAQQSMLSLGSQHLHFTREYKIYSWVNHLGIMVKNERWYNFLRDWPWIVVYELAKFFYYLLTAPVVMVKAVRRFLTLLPSFLHKRGALAATWRVHPKELRKWWVKK